MEIKDPIALYSFFGQLGYLGGAVLSFLITLIAVYFAANIISKLTDNQKLRSIFLVCVSILVFAGMMIITILASTKNKQLTEANSLKAYLTTQNWKFLSLFRIANEVSLSSGKLALKDQNLKETDNKIIKRIEDIKDLVDKFPNEFVIRNVTDPDMKERLGINLVDTLSVKSIDLYYESMIPFFKAKIENYMKNKSLDKLTYIEIRESVDDRCEDFALDMMIGKNLNTFLPIDIIRIENNKPIPYYALSLKKQEPLNGKNLDSLKNK